MGKQYGQRRSFRSRPERLVPEPSKDLDVLLVIPGEGQATGRLQDISRSGLSVMCFGKRDGVTTGTPVDTISLLLPDGPFHFGSGSVRRLIRIAHSAVTTDIYVLAVAFDIDRAEEIKGLRPHLVPPPYVRTELTEGWADQFELEPRGEEHSLLDFQRLDAPDLFAKCKAFYKAAGVMQRRKMFQALYRVTLTSGLDHRITVFNPLSRREEEMICFDSNGYLGLHKHPRVLAATKKALDEVGYGTPSAQLVSGTNKYLRELEETLSLFHGRQDALVFSSGYAASLGVITALVRESDLVVRDASVHASLVDGIAAARPKLVKTYPHNDVANLGQTLERAAADSGFQGKLVVTDGVFGMHGDLCPLPEIAAFCKRFGAKLLIDDAHGTGVLGKTGRGIEEHFGQAGAADILLCTFSKAPGTTGAYVTGSHELITYLRFFARSGVYSASLPAALCAGVTEAYRVMDEEPEHREQLWRNTRDFGRRLKAIGYNTPEAQSPVLTCLLGSERLLFAVVRDLFMNGIKCGSLTAPMVTKDRAALRFSINARHTDDDIDCSIDLLEKLGRKHSILHRTPEELIEIGKRLPIFEPT